MAKKISWAFAKNNRRLAELTGLVKTKSTEFDEELHDLSCERTFLGGINRAIHRINLSNRSLILHLPLAYDECFLQKIIAHNLILNCMT